MDRIKKFEPLWGMWRCEAVIGEGSFGTVYRAVRKDADRVYYSAIKHISVPTNQSQLNEVRSSGFYNSDADIIKYFDGIAGDVRREIDFMYTLKGNANIVSYEDHLVIPKEDGIGCDIFIRMELLRSLNSIIKSNLTVEDAVKIGSDICNALDVCAKSHIVHRDIKPSNIFVNANGDYKLGDFGIAKILDSATAGMSKKGTYFYMAPEIYKCEPANFTSDIYSLGIVLYRILNGNCLPFMPTSGTILLEHQENAIVKMMTGQPMPPPRNATPQLAAVILKACSFNMRDRFQTPLEFKQALNDAYLGKYVEKVPEFYEETVNADVQNTVTNDAIVAENKAYSEKSAVSVQPVHRVPEPKKTEKKSAAAETKKKRPRIGIIAALICLAFFAAAMAALFNSGIFPEGEPDDVIYGEVSETDAEPEIILDLPPEGEVLNIYLWNEEFKGYFEQYYEVPDGIEVRWIINTDQNNIYQDSLDEALADSENMQEDDRVDIFLVEPSYAAKYVDSDYTMDVRQIGFRNSDAMYDYAVDMCTDSDGVCKGIAPMITPGTLIYRRSIAREVLGTDSPDEVQVMLGSWDRFEDVAAMAKSEGYYMTASCQETFRAYTSNRSTPWVDDSGNINVPPEFEEWAKFSRSMVKNKTTLKVGLWDKKWYNQMMGSGKTMCFFGPEWYYDYIIAMTTDIPGDWAVCRGPQDYSYGGYCILVASGTDNPRTIRHLFEAFTTDEDLLDEYARDNRLMANNSDVMEAIADDHTYTSYFLGDQNDVQIQTEVAEKVRWENHTMYDFHLDTGFMECMKSYINGSCSYDDALSDFYYYTQECYPQLG